MTLYFREVQQNDIDAEVCLRPQMHSCVNSASPTKEDLMNHLDLKKMLSKLRNPRYLFKVMFLSMLAIMLIDALCFIKNVCSHNVGMCIFNVILFFGVGYHVLLMLVAIYKRQYQRNVVILIGIDLCSLIAYILCPIYVAVAFINTQVNFILPVGLSALLCHFFFIPTLRSWLE